MKPMRALGSPLTLDNLSSSSEPEHGIAETSKPLLVEATLKAAPAEIVKPSATLAVPARHEPAAVALRELGNVMPPLVAPRPSATAVEQVPPLLETVAGYERAEPVSACASAQQDNRLATPTPRLSASTTDFGMRLAAAARAQMADLVIYDEKYRRIPYPLGDVPPLYGVCTDVVIRAYRAMGIDLQALVQQAGLGTGDSSIDHRRTEILRRFFARHGERLQVTHFADDYRPGDIVTYRRPQNSGARSHIALVSDRPGPSGRLMIVHNRGWGPQLEDALFVDEITGHYRFTGPVGEMSEARLYGAPPIHRRSRKARPAAFTP